MHKFISRIIMLPGKAHSSTYPSSTPATHLSTGDAGQMPEAEFLSPLCKTNKRAFQPT